MRPDDPDQKPQPREPAHAYALRLLAARAYPVRSLGRKLTQRGYPQPDIDATLARLSESGLLDDRKFAEHYARSRIVNDAASPRRVVQLLSRNGIPHRLAEESVQRVVEDEELDPAENAHVLARKKAAMLAGLEPPVVRRRLYGYLARRGFDLADIRAAVAAALDGINVE
jgi:regulatory protein